MCFDFVSFHFFNSLNGLDQPKGNDFANEVCKPVQNEGGTPVLQHAVTPPNSDVSEDSDGGISLAGSVDTVNAFKDDELAVELLEDDLVNFDFDEPALANLDEIQQDDGNLDLDPIPVKLVSRDLKTGKLLFLYFYCVYLPGLMVFFYLICIYSRTRMGSQVCARDSRRRC